MGGEGCGTCNATTDVKTSTFSSFRETTVSQPPPPPLLPPYAHHNMVPPWWMYGPPPGVTPPPFAPSADADTLRQVLHTVTEIRTEQQTRSARRDAAVAKAATDDVLSRLLAVFDPHAHYEGSDVLALVRATQHAPPPAPPPPEAAEDEECL